MNSPVITNQGQCKMTYNFPLWFMNEIKRDVIYVILWSLLQLQSIALIEVKV